MKKLTVLMIMTIALLFGATTETQAKDWEFSIGPSYTLTGEDHGYQFKDRVGGYVGLDYSFTDHWSIYGSFSTNWNQIRYFDTDWEYKLMVWDVGAKYCLNSDDAWNFYIMAGGSWVRTDVDGMAGFNENHIENQFAPVLGAGFYRPIGKTWGYSAEFKYRHLPESSAPIGPGFNIDNYSLALGLTFRF